MQILMILLFFHLLVILMNISTSRVGNLYNWLVKIPFQIYAGWITVALIANVSIFFKKNGLDEAGVLSEPIWAIAILIVALIIYYLVMRWRDFPVYGLIGSWATAGIAAAQWNVQSEVGWTAAIVSFLLLVLSVKGMIRD